MTPSPPIGQKWLRVRLAIAASVLTGLFGLLAYKAWALQIRDGAKMQELGLRQVLQELVLPAPRGTIRDANGVELAVTVNVDSAFVNPRLVVDVAGSAAKLAPILGIDEREIEEKLASGRRFEWLERRLSPEKAKAVHELALPGVSLVAEPRRYYPLRDLAGPVLGFANIDGKGIEGLELALDDKLRGERSTMPAIRDRHGDLVVASDLDPRGDGTATAATPGSTITLTIDRTMQFAAERALAEGVKENKAKAGLVVVMNPQNGEILAMASTPGYDPNQSGVHNDNENADKDSSARDRPVTDAYEPGSVMKVFSVSAALEAKVVKPSDEVDLEGGRLQMGKYTFTDTHAHGVVPIGDVIKFSSNVGAAKIARKLGTEKLVAQYRKFGFFARTGIELPGESRGRLSDIRHWGDTGLATASFGYGLQVSPIQITAALGAVANGGTWYQPAIVKQIVGPDGKITYDHVAQGHAVISAETAKAMTEMMKTVLEKGGTAETLKVPGFVIAGKTGTAYKHDPVTKHYSHDRYLASFVGFVPADKPRLVIVVMIDEPRAGKHYGADVSAPVFGAIAEDCLKYLGVAADPATLAAEAAEKAQKAEKAAKNAKPTKAKPVVVAAVAADDLPSDMDIPDLDEDEASAPAGPGEAIVMIPDFTGLSVAQSLAAARAAGVKVEIEGSGRAVRQFPPAGRALKSIACHVTFNPG